MHVVSRWTASDIRGMDGWWMDGWMASVEPDGRARPTQTQSPRVRVLERHQSRSQLELATGTEGGREGEWDWCGRSGHHEDRGQTSRSGETETEGGRLRLRLGPPTSSRPLALAAGSAQPQLSTVSISFLSSPSFLLAWLPWLPRRPYMKCIYKEESQESGESFSGRKAGRVYRPAAVPTVQFHHCCTLFKMFSSS